MEEEGLCPDDVFRQCLFRQNERDMVLKAVRIIKPDYEPPPATQNPLCSLPLVKDFYTQVPNQGDRLYSSLESVYIATPTNSLGGHTLRYNKNDPKTIKLTDERDNSCAISQ